MEGFSIKIDPIWRKKDVIGVDIGSDSIKFVQLRKAHGKTKLVGYGRMPVPENYIIEGIVAEPEKLAEAIKKFFTSGSWGKLVAQRVCTAVPESKIFTHTMTIPHKAEKSLSDAVTWEAGQTIPMSASDLYMDYQVIGPDDTEVGQDVVLYSAAPKAIVDSYVQLFSILGLEVESVETSLTAIMRSILPQKRHREPYLIIDIGRNTTNLAVVDSIIRVTGSTLIGGDQLTYRVSEALKISEKDSEKLKKGKSQKEETQISSGLDSEVTAIIGEATRMINYFEQKSDGKKKVTKVLLCGGSAGLAGLAEVFHSKLGIDTETGNPWQNISVYPLKSIPHEDIPGFSTAVGLAMLGVIDD